MSYKIIAVNNLVMMDFIIWAKFVKLAIKDVQNVIHQILINASNVNKIIFWLILKIYVVLKVNNIYKMVNANLAVIKDFMLIQIIFVKVFYFIFILKAATKVALLVLTILLIHALYANKIIYW